MIFDDSSDAGFPTLPFDKIPPVSNFFGYVGGFGASFSCVVKGLLYGILLSAGLPAPIKLAPWGGKF